MRSLEREVGFFEVLNFFLRIFIDDGNNLVQEGEMDDAGKEKKRNGS